MFFAIFDILYPDFSTSQVYFIDMFCIGRLSKRVFLFYSILLKEHKL